ETPYRHELVRWGTALHDRFMLPHYIWEDLREICADLQEHDIPFHLDWLAPFSEFRFPRYGHIRIGEIDIELRAAIEPWHVLGEEMT
ncbi:transglutaminase-like family protein, partial [Acidithiobacillus ferrooxidans]|nr:transglutaminase-like family protein [Acidithiobacillus ferrooxidans]